MRDKLLGGALLVGAALAATGAGMFVFPQILPGTFNTTALVSPDGIYTQLTPGENMNPPSPSNCCGPRIPVDTNQPGGAAPQTVNATPFQVAATAADAFNNTATSTAAAATQNTLGGLVTTESLSTAVGSTYTFTLTDSAVTTAYAASGAIPQVAMYSKSNTGGTLVPQVQGNGVGAAVSYSAQMQLVSTTVTGASTNTIVWVFKNVGGSALNGTMMIAWHL